MNLDVSDRLGLQLKSVIYTSCSILTRACGVSCSPCTCVGSLQVLLLLPTVQEEQGQVDISYYKAVTKKKSEKINIRKNKEKIAFSTVHTSVLCVCAGMGIVRTSQAPTPPAETDNCRHLRCYHPSQKHYPISDLWVGECVSQARTRVQSCHWMCA